jgi:hypothetical protein
MDYEVNKFQTVLDNKLLEDLPKEVRSDLIEAIEGIKFVRWLISPEEVRGYAKDKPHGPDSKVVVDITKPHILEDMEFFRERAIHHEQFGCYTKLHPNPNPKSEYAEFWREEVKRWKEGLVRPSDGEWITGYHYFYLNYSPIWVNEEVKQDTKNKAKVRGIRKRNFPDVFLGDYLWFHYMHQAREAGAHCKMLKARGIGASFKLGAITPCTMYTDPGLPNFHLASDKTFLEGDKGVFGKVTDVLDWIGDNTPLPKMRLIDKPLEKQIGYKDEYGARKGLKSSVFGISMKDNPDKARGIRGPIIHYEEDGLFPNLENAWNVNLEAVQGGGIVFGQMVALGTGGTEGADFAGSEKLFYYPDTYNIYGIPNVFDKNVNSENKCGFFWGAYLNRARYYNKSNGEPDVIGALIEIFKERYKIKYSSSDPNAITQKKAELPITPQESIMRRDGTIFPISDLKDYLSEVMPNFKSFVRPHYVGRLQIMGDGCVEFVDAPQLTPIRDYPLKDTLNREGAVEIFEKPQFNVDKRTESFRYIAGIDPIDSDDNITTDSLPSIFILDRYTDRIVAEYTGRPRTANEFFEVCKRLLMYYGATANYENNLKGLFVYFENQHCTHLLCDNPSILDEKGIANTKGNFGNKKKGTTASATINAWGRRLQADWQISPAYGEENEGKLNLHKIRSIGYLKECIGWNPDGNFDRVSAMGMLMIYREEVAKIEIRRVLDKNKTRFEDPWFNKWIGVKKDKEKQFML